VGEVGHTSRREMHEEGFFFFFSESIYRGTSRRLASRPRVLGKRHPVFFINSPWAGDAGLEVCEISRCSRAQSF